VAEVEKTLRAAFKNDRARTDVGRISRFGLLEIVRQRLGSSALSITSEPCPHCHGSGQRRNLEWQALTVLKDIYRQMRKEAGPECVMAKVSEELALYLLNNKRVRLLAMEDEFKKKITVSAG
jgi:ribonuclease E